MSEPRWFTEARRPVTVDELPAGAQLTLDDLRQLDVYDVLRDVEHEQRASRVPTSGRATRGSGAVNAPAVPEPQPDTPRDRGDGGNSMLAALHLAALRAAGLNGTAPPGSGAFKQMISTLTGNAEFLIVGGIGLALTIVAGLVIFGSMRAPEYVFRILAGIVLLLVVIPGVLA